MIKGFFGAIAALGLACAVFGVYFIITAHEARFWPRTEGEVVSTTVRAQTLHAAGTQASRRARERFRTYYPEITYRWTVAGQAHTGSRYSLGESHPDYPERAQAVLAAATYPGGRTVDVFYDPADPGSAVLDRSLKGGAFVPLPLGLLMLALGAIGLRHAPAIEAAARQGATQGAAGEPGAP